MVNNVNNELLILILTFLSSVLDSDSDSVALQISHKQFGRLGHKLQHDCTSGKIRSDSLFFNTFIFLLQICSHVLAYTNSCLNPILYAKMSRNFRCGFSQVRRKINKKYTQNLFACCEELKGSL